MIMIALITLPKDAIAVRVELGNGQALLTFYGPNETELHSVQLVNNGQAQGASVAIPDHVGDAGGSGTGEKYTPHLVPTISTAHGVVGSSGSGGISVNSPTHGGSTVGANVRGEGAKIEIH